MKINAVDFIQRDHRLILDSLDALEDTLDDDVTSEVGELTKMIRQQLKSHDIAEQEILYPALALHRDLAPFLSEAADEERIIKSLVAELDGPHDAAWRAKVHVLHKVVKLHFKDEENRILRRAKKTLDQDQLDDLGISLIRLRDELFSEIEPVSTAIR